MGLGAPFLLGARSCAEAGKPASSEIKTAATRLRIVFHTIQICCKESILRQESLTSKLMGSPRKLSVFSNSNYASSLPHQLVGYLQADSIEQTISGPCQFLAIARHRKQSWQRRGGPKRAFSFRQGSACGMFACFVCSKQCVIGRERPDDVS